MKQSTSVYHIEDALPEQRLIAAMLRQAVLDTKSGSKVALQWIERDSAPWVALITPPTDDPERVHVRLVELARRSASERKYK